ncbi:MAG: DUF2167 domain-containing protein [Planctomycetota bacterium]
MADPADLQAVAAFKELANGAHFLKGQHLCRLRPQTDNLAAYGIGGLIAGKLALKAGLFKVIALFLAKFWKLDPDWHRGHRWIHRQTLRPQVGARSAPSHRAHCRRPRF